ncbi:MAG: hypothetical protein ACYDC2_04230 [Solirubrobacteraceae bacterium]
MARLENSLEGDSRPLSDTAHSGLGSLEPAEYDFVLSQEQRAEIARRVGVVGKFGGAPGDAVVQRDKVRLLHTGPEALGDVLGHVGMRHADKVGRGSTPRKRGNPTGDPARPYA